ncbi:hypothetical protein H2199_006982 [Coniosporium tulheliwenetii]|uniref:Uncharacterized protein n=1 Tax=Coniosporium tulheliwenetii TaxID=3383036 RepID=A0ACC2YSC3_9PEZI|nr:hypothetical protein H2199_006982 [Cladosporium sp. JES 115]
MHRAKRQFQPSITTFFGRADRGDYGFDSSLSFGEPQFLTPHLPAAVQASLLNVGMRVRKSVPEGYKTHKTLPPSNSINAAPPYTFAHQTQAAPSKPVELLPYCGLLKTGGLTPPPRLLPSPISDFPNDAATAAIPTQAAPVFNMTHPQQTTPLNTRKRSYSDAAVDDDAISPFQLDPHHLPHPANHLAVQKWLDDEPVSPRSIYPVSHTAMPDLSSLRPLARPRTRRKGSGGSGEAVRGESHGGSEGVLDFGEAEFLQPEGEVEMGGM